MVSRRLKTASRRPKIAPRPLPDSPRTPHDPQKSMKNHCFFDVFGGSPDGLKNGPKTFQNRRKTSPRRHKTPQDAPRPPQDRPKTAPRPPQDRPRTAPRTPQDRPKDVPRRPKMLQHRPRRLKTAQRCPQTPQDPILERFGTDFGSNWSRFSTDLEPILDQFWNGF